MLRQLVPSCQGSAESWAEMTNIINDKKTETHVLKNYKLIVTT